MIEVHLEVLERLTCLARFAQIWMHGGVHEDNYMKLYYITNKKEYHNALFSIIKGERNITIEKHEITSTMIMKRASINHFKIKHDGAHHNLHYT